MTILTESRKKLLWEMAREVGFDMFFLKGLPWISKRMGQPATAEDHVVAAEARAHINKGEHKEAAKILATHFMGWGLDDEEIYDETREAVLRARMATRSKLIQVGKWLDTDERLRTRFRISLTLQKDKITRMRVLAYYANLDNDADRLSEFVSTGKLDEQLDEKIWNWVKTNVPAFSATAWAGLCSATGATWSACTGTAFPGIKSAVSATGHGIANGARAVGRTAVDANNQLDALGRRLQANNPLPPAQPRSGLTQWLVNRIR